MSDFAARLKMNQKIVDLSNAFCDRNTRRTWPFTVEQKYLIKNKARLRSLHWTPKWVRTFVETKSSSCLLWRYRCLNSSLKKTSCDEWEIRDVSGIACETHNVSLSVTVLSLTSYGFSTHTPHSSSFCVRFSNSVALHSSLFKSLIQDLVLSFSADYVRTRFWNDVLVAAVSSANTRERL